MPPARRRIQLLPVTDYTGGLNLRADAFQLRGSETPDCLNVDLDPRGGFALRQGVAPLNATAAASVPKNIWNYATGAGTFQVLIQTGNDLAYSTGGNFTAVNPDALATTGIMRAATFKDANYIARNAEHPVVKWNGTASSILGVTFNDDLTAPNSGDMPAAKYLASWGGHMWCANTLESATSHRNRVRFSHPNFPEDWRNDDFIDIDIGHDGDEITALVPFQDRLLIFKHNSIHQITGHDPDTFQVDTVSDTLGAISQEAVAVTEFGVYFFSWPEGVCLLTDGKVAWQFERLSPIITEARINIAQYMKITLGWINRRLWVNVPWGEDTTNSRVFVLDPTLGQRARRGQPATEGGWTQYDLPLGPMLEWQAPGSTTTHLACHATEEHVLKLHQDSAQDDLGAGAVNISSYYKTRWFDDDEVAVPKRWKRPEVVVDGEPPIRIRVDVWRDFDESSIARTMHFDTLALDTDALEWGTGSDENKWGNNVWAASDLAEQEIRRLSALGRARAVQLKFTPVTTPSVEWAVNSITFKIVKRRVR